MDQNSIKYKFPKATTGVVIYRKINKQIEILMTKRNIEPFKNYWCLPGGHIEPFERLEIAASREAKEETNLEFIPEGFLGYFEEIFPEIQLHNIALFLYGQAKGNMQKEIEEVSAIDWYPAEEALALKLAFTHHDVIKSFLQNIS